MSIFTNKIWLAVLGLCAALAAIASVSLCVQDRNERQAQARRIEAETEAHNLRTQIECDRIDTLARERTRERADELSEVPYVADDDLCDAINDILGIAE